MVSISRVRVHSTNGSCASEIILAVAYLFLHVEDFDLERINRSKPGRSIEIKPYDKLKLSKGLDRFFLFSPGQT